MDSEAPRNGPEVNDAFAALARLVLADHSMEPTFTSLATERGAASSLSIPIPLQREVAAALNIYRRRPRAFDPADRQLADTFATYAGVAIANMHAVETQSRVAEQLQAAMQSRAVIEQAKGILMAQHACSADEAFAMLVDRSQRSNRKLRDGAQSLVDSAKAAGAQA